MLANYKTVMLFTFMLLFVSFVSASSINLDSSNLMGLRSSFSSDSVLYCSQNFLKLSGGVVSGNVQLNMAKIITTSLPDCDVTQRGALATTFGALGVADTIQVCSKNVLNAYAWRVVSVA